jgi:ribosomal protein S1
MSETQNRPTMKDLLQKVSISDELKINDQISGKIIFLAKNQCLIEIKNIGLGIVRGKELYNEDFLSKLKIGEEIESIVIELDNELGMVELSFRAIGKDKIWQDIQQSFEDKSTVEARIKDANRGGFLVKVKGVDGFLPASLLAPTHAIKNATVEENSLISQMKKYVGQIFNVKIININTETESLILSEKSVSDEIARIKLQKFQIGQTIEGTVVGVVDFGIFVRFDDDLEGLVHISEIAWKKVEDPRKDYKIGQKVQAKIIDIDEENRINLSIKQLMQNPWAAFAKGTKPGGKFTGTVSKIVSYGAIVVNDQDIQGLCHISQMTEETLDSPAKIHDILKIGQSKEFTILSLDSDEKLYLTLLDFDKAMEIQNTMANSKSEKVEEEAVS